MEAVVAKCLNCEDTLSGPYCSQCGQRAVTERLSARYLIGEAVGHGLDLDAALPRTVVDLTLRPGSAVRDWVDGKRKRYVGPAQYFATALAVLFLVFTLRHVRPSDLAPRQAKLPAVPEVQDAVAELVRLLDQHFQFLVFATVPFFSMATGLLYRRWGSTLAERFVLFAYVIAHAALLGSLPRLVLGATSTPLNVTLAIAGLGYYAWGTRGFFGSGWLRALAAIVLGYAGFMLAMTVSTAIVMAVAIALSSGR